MLTCKKRTLKYFFICLLAIVCKIASAQQTAVDSLQKTLNTNLHDSVKVGTLLRISHAYFGIQVDSVHKYAQQSLGLSEKINYAYGT